MKKATLIITLLFSFWMPAFGAVTVTLDQSSLPRYHVLELTLTADADLSNPFQRPFTAVFTAPDGNARQVGGFYDGGRRWKMRFMPNQVGTWRLEWAFEGSHGQASFSCTAQTHPKIHGHFYVDPLHPRKLRYEDGTPLFWHGGKYLCIMRPFGTADLQELSYPERLITEAYIDYCRSYFKKISDFGLNGAVFKAQVLPLKYNLKEMNLAFLKAMDTIVSEAMWNGINLQITLFDPWGKRKDNVDWSAQTPASADWLLLEPWNENTYVAETRFYLEYMVNRYAAFPNVMWELWNEAEKLKVSAKSASKVYRSIIRAADPYDLPIGASEMYTAPYSLDFCHPHLKYKCWPDQWDFMDWAVRNDKRYAPYYFNYSMPYIWNEIGPWDNDASHVFTEEERRGWFRAMFWSALTLGAAGMSEEHWSDIRAVPDELTVQHAHFIRFTAALKDINALEPVPDWQPLNGKGYLCRNGDNEAAAYLFTRQNNSRIDFDVLFGPGTIDYQFYDPKSGKWLGSPNRQVISSGGKQRFRTPSFDQDIVFYASSAPSVHVPVEWETLEAKSEGDSLVLRWRTLSECNNLGFEISRLRKGEPQIIGFVAGHGTTAEPHDYSFVDRPLPGHYTYFVRQIDTDGRSTTRSVSVEFSGENSRKPFPNPGRGMVSIPLPNALSPCEVVIYNALGQTVARLHPSESVLKWNGRTAHAEAAAGLYFYRVFISGEKEAVLQGKFYLQP